MLPMSNRVNNDDNKKSSNQSSTLTNKINNTKKTPNRCNHLAITSSKAPEVELPIVTDFLNKESRTQIYESRNDSKSSYQFIQPQKLFSQIRENQQKKTFEVAAVQSAEYHNNSSDNLIVYCDGNIFSGTLEALIEHLVPTCDYYPEESYIFTFLLSSRLFIRPDELLSKVATIWQQQQSISSVITSDLNITLHHHRMPVSNTENSCPQKSSPSYIETFSDACKFQQSVKTSTHNCLRLLEDWIKTFPYDFRDECLMQQVRILSRRCVYIDNSLSKQVSHILQWLVQNLTALEKYEELLQSYATPVMNLSGKQLVKQKISNTDSSSCRSNQGASDYQAFEKSSTTYSYTNESLKFVPSTTFSNNVPSTSQPLTLQQQQHQHNRQYPQNGSSSNFTLHYLSGSFFSTSSISDIEEITDMCPNPEVLAHQLTAIELEYLSHIGPQEFIQTFPKECQHPFVIKKSTSLNDTNIDECSDIKINTKYIIPSSDLKKTRNLEAYVQWFNRLSYFTATEILKHPKKKQRVRVIEYLIETARECFNIGNFNSLMAIIAGLNLAPISRLRKTWSKVDSLKLSILEHQMDPTSNFNSYRSTLKAAVWRSEGATDDRERIIIPFFSLFVKDLYFLNEGCSSRLPNNHINFEKCIQLAKHVKEFSEWKTVTCPYKKLSEVITFLQTSQFLNENTLMLASFECEPPENTHEKGRYKILKSETKQQLQQLHDQKL